jgi:hypothetical protein
MSRRCDEFGKFKDRSEDELTDELIDVLNCQCEEHGETVIDNNDRPMTKEEIADHRKEIRAHAGAMLVRLQAKSMSINNLLYTIEYEQGLTEEQVNELYTSLRDIVKE